MPLIEHWVMFGVRHFFDFFFPPLLTALPKYYQTTGKNPQKTKMACGFGFFPPTGCRSFLQITNSYRLPIWRQGVKVLLTVVISITQLLSLEDLDSRCNPKTGTLLWGTLIPFCFLNHHMWQGLAPGTLWNNSLHPGTKAGGHFRMQYEKKNPLLLDFRGIFWMLE